GGSPVAMSSHTRRPRAGCSGVDGAFGLVTKLLDQLGRGRTWLRTARPYPCSLFPMTPTATPPGEPTFMARVRRRFRSLTSCPCVPTRTPNLAEATMAAFTRAPDTFGTRLAVVRSPVG